MSSQMDEVFPSDGGDGDNNCDSGDVEQLALNADSGGNLPVVSSSASSSTAKITASATMAEMSADETGLNLNSTAAECAVPSATEDDGYEPCDPLTILNLFQSLSTTTSSLELQMKINLHLKKLTNSPYVFLVPILHSSEEGLIQVINDNVLDKEIRFSINSTHLKNASQQNGYPFVIDDLNKDFSEVIEMVVGNKHNTLIYDIKSPRVSKLQTQISTTSTSSTASFDGGSSAQQQQHNNSNGNSTGSSSSKNNHSHLQQQQIALFVCIAGNSHSRSRYQFYIEDTFRYVLGHLLTAFDLFEEKRVRYQCQNLLQVARRLLGKIGDLGQLLRGVMTEAKELAVAERCSLFLLDKQTGELVSKVFDGNEATKEIRIESGKGIAGYVAQTGNLLNIRNAYQHPLFYKGVDESTGFKTRNILCFPICDEQGVIGVAQLCNKLNGFHFDKCDEEVATAFSVYCGISIMHALVHKQVQKAEARYKLSQELLLYHMKVPDTEIQHVLEAVNAHEADQFAMELPRFDFCPRDVNNFALSVQLSIKMFYDLNFVTTFQIPEDKLARFILLVQKGYRDTPYHNWWHAFSVAHFAYSLMVNLKLIENGIITKMQGFSFLIAAFCHDLDHRGTSNTYQTQSSSPLARLYSSEGSVNERHHLSQAICILNDSSSKILDSLSTEEFKECIDFLKDLILATDLANHFRITPHLKRLRAENLSEGSNQRLLLSLLITCCDLNDQIKSWRTVQHVAHLVYAEFFAEGDLEIQMGLRPNTMMDRKKACIPVLQIEFLTTVVRPTFEFLTQIFPETDPFLETIDSNRQQWEYIKENGTCTGGNECCEFEGKNCNNTSM